MERNLFQQRCQPQEPSSVATLSLLTDWVQLENTKLNSSTSEMKRELQVFKDQALVFMSNVMEKSPPMD